MYKLSEVLSKPILSLFNGRVEGTIKTAIFDKKLQKIKYLLGFNENEQNDEYIIPVSSIFTIGENALVVKNSSCLEPLSNFEPQITFNNPINLYAFTTKGNGLGNVTDVFFDEKFVVEKIALSNNQIIDITNLASFSESALIVQDKDKKVNVSKFCEQRRPRLIKSDEPVTILRTDNIQTIETMPQQKIAALPSKVTSSVNFLVGRTITQNLYSQSKELIAKKGTPISLKTIENAKRNGKIKELSIFSM